MLSISKAFSYHELGHLNFYSFIDLFQKAQNKELSFDNLLKKEKDDFSFTISQSFSSLSFKEIVSQQITAIKKFDEEHGKQLQFRSQFKVFSHFQQRLLLSSDELNVETASFYTNAFKCFYAHSDQKAKEKLFYECFSNISQAFSLLDEFMPNISSKLEAKKKKVEKEGLKEFFSSSPYLLYFCLISSYLKMAQSQELKVFDKIPFFYSGLFFPTAHVLMGKNFFEIKNKQHFIKELLTEPPLTIS